MALTREPGRERESYEQHEERPSLIERGVEAPWTAMEREVFNAVTRHWDRAPDTPIFSERLRTTAAMLAMFDTVAGDPKVRGERE